MKHSKFVDMPTSPRALVLNVTIQSSNSQPKKLVPAAEFSQEQESDDKSVDSLDEAQSHQDEEVKFQGEFNWEGFSQVEELTQTNTSLLAQLQAADKSVEE